MPKIVTYSIPIQETAPNEIGWDNQGAFFTASVRTAINATAKRRLAKRRKICFA